MSRRGLLTLGAGSAAGLLGGSPAEAAVASLRIAAAAKGLRFGAAWEVDELPFARVPVEFRSLFIDQCSLFAPNISYHRISPSPGTYDYGFIQPAISFCLDHGLRMSGGHLLYYLTTPAWYGALPDRAAAERAALDYIGTVAGRYRGHVYSWNVVNEAIKPEDGRPDGFRANNPYLRSIGPDYFGLAFHAARAADPAALLVYNDYGMELDNAADAARRRLLLDLLDRFRRARIPIDAIGLQSHLPARGFDMFDPGVYRDFLKEIAARGVAILITECDVIDLSTPADIAARDRIVADIYAKFLDVALAEPAVKALILWGLSDRYTYQTARFNPKLGRPDGLPTRPLPFDDAFAAKPAFWAIKRAIEAAPSRRPL